MSRMSDLHIKISEKLERKLGRLPTNEEIVSEWHSMKMEETETDRINKLLDKKDYRSCVQCLSKIFEHEEGDLCRWCLDDVEEDIREVE